MDIKQIEIELNQYFDYIKTIYMNEYKKYMNGNTLKSIQKMNNVIEIEKELSFKINIKDKIVFNLNLEKYIEENRLKDENNLKDLSKESKDYIAYLVKNEKNVLEILKNKLLHEILLYFIKPNNNVVALGTINIIEDNLSEKYKLPKESFFKSKEKDVAKYISSIVGEDNLLVGIINNDEKIIASNYNLYAEDKDNYQSFLKKINKIYFEYFKKLGKIYLPDSLYEYDNLDYNLKECTKKIKEEKNQVNISRLKRLISIQECIFKINHYFQNHKLLITVLEKKELENSLYEIDKIIEKIKKDGKQNIARNVSEEYNNILNIENDIIKYSIRIWQNELLVPDKYQVGGTFNFLLSEKITDDIIEATYISSEHLKNIKKLKSNYGYIYEPLDDSIIYSSTDDILYKKYEKNNYYQNYNSILVNDYYIEIDNQASSRLLIPDIILQKNLDSKMIQNRIILNAKNVRKVGIYCFVDDDIENDSNYNKALELSEDEELPIIKIYKNIYFNGIEPEKIIVKIDEKDNFIREKKPSIFSKIKNSIYEEEYNEFKKTL